MSQAMPEASFHAPDCQAILDLGRHVVFAIDSAGRITSFNDAAVWATGVTHDQALGRPCRELFHSLICRHVAECPMDELKRTGCHSTRRRIPADCGSGVSGTIEITLQGLFDDQRRLAGAIGTHNSRPPGRASFGNGNMGAIGVTRPALDTPDANLPILRATERLAIEQVLNRHGWNRAAACRELGFSRTTLWRKMRKLGISSPRDSGDSSKLR